MTAPNRYARQIALAELGAEGQARLGAASMLIVGMGGLGCPAAQYLAGSGVGRLILNDFDHVDLSNLPRQILFGDDAIGSLKTEAAAATLARLNPGVKLELISERLDEAGFERAARRVDIVLDCTDNFGTRLQINRACVAAGTPLVTGAALRLEGQLAVFANRAGEPCYRCLYSEDDEMLGNCEGNGVLAPVPGIIGCLMAVEAIKLAAIGSTDMNGRLLIFDAMSMSWQSLALKRDPECPVCSRRAQSRT